MTLRDEFQAALEAEEHRTVGDSFGGQPLDQSLSYGINALTQALLETIVRYPDDPISQFIHGLDGLDSRELKYLISAAIRFSFIIELTNLRITSTKMKTRWLSGRIVKTTPGTFTNFQGDFAPGQDPRSSSFNDCFDVFKTVMDLLSDSQEHLGVVRELSGNKRRIPYEFVFTYIDPSINPVHVSTNIRLVACDDITSLIQARPIIRSALPTATANKIKTKAYLTDRSQTGTDQTNRAKRWEVLANDFQHATLEQCWSVERGLLSDLAHFRNFPEEVRRDLLEHGLFEAADRTTRCPVTLEELDYTEFVQGSAHGEADFQVGHLRPLKAGGNHEGDNVAWITANGNRLQGDMEINEVRTLLREIAQRMTDLDIV